MGGKAPEPDPPEVEDDDHVGATVIFFVQNSEPKVDISVADYSDESIQDLTTLLIGLTGSLFFVPTLDMIKEGLLAENEHESLLKIVSSLGEMEYLGGKPSDGKEEPCIKPQDAI